MPPSLKKPSDKSSAVSVPAWHPNFRNVERLPDTKVVRTSFFVNGVAIFIALSLAIYVGYREYGLQSMRADTANAVASIAANKPASDQAVIQFKKFQEEEFKVVSLQQFLAGNKIVLSDFILRLGAGLPPSTVLTNVDYSQTGLVLRGNISGSSEEASGRAVAYVDSFRRGDYFGKLFGEVTLTNVVRDATTGQIRFQIDLKLKVLNTGVKK